MVTELIILAVCFICICTQPPSLLATAADMIVQHGHSKRSEVTKLGLSALSSEDDTVTLFIGSRGTQHSINRAGKDV